MFSRLKKKSSDKTDRHIYFNNSNVAAVDKLYLNTANVLKLQYTLLEIFYLKQKRKKLLII